jgi:hypothetical protein
MQAFWNNPIVVTISDSLAPILTAFAYQVRSFEPVTWMLMALVTAMVWMFLMRPPA